MLLYHGTNERVARLALTDGLKPRGRSKRGNWKHTMTSNAETVYLTICYAGYFASVATKRAGDRLTLIEIESDRLDSTRFRPDEDALEQGSRGTGDGMSRTKMVQRTKDFRSRLDDYAHFWKASLEFMGTCGYKGIIPPAAIRRVALFLPSSHPGLAMAWVDPTITPLNYKLLGSKYRALTTLTMGDPMPRAEFIEATCLGMLAPPMSMLEWVDRFLSVKPDVILLEPERAVR